MDFSGINLSRASLYRAFAEGLNLCNAVFEGSHVEEGDFSRAAFRGATFRSTTFNKTILTGANLDGATFVNWQPQPSDSGGRLISRQGDHGNSGLWNRSVGSSDVR